MPDPRTDLNLLMVHADSRAPVLGEPLPGASARGVGAPAATSGAALWDEGGDPNDLAAQRWGLLAPQGPAGDRLLALVKPLVDLRGDQQAAPPRVFRVPPGLDAAAAARWKKQVFETGADLGVETPRYQLILGDLDQVPLAVQQVQQSDGYVGRLAFTADDDYASYVDKVLRWERQPAAAPASALFYTVHDGTAATSVGFKALIEPGVAVAHGSQASGHYPARAIVAFGDRARPSRDELVARVAAIEPSVLFTLSHGEGPPLGGWATPEEQRRRQGAMSLGGEHLLGEDLRGRAFLPGGLWFMLACYGAGTPDASAYRQWLLALRDAGEFRGNIEPVLAGLPRPGEPPFVAAVPQAALASPQGPLAFIGHVDLAWSYGFEERDAGVSERPGRYVAVTRAALRRDRAGVALRELVRYAGQTDLELTSLYDQEAQARAGGLSLRVDPARRGHLWMLRQDLMSYVLLGDPAARLPAAKPDASASIAPSPAAATPAVASFTANPDPNAMPTSTQPNAASPDATPQDGDKAAAPPPGAATSAGPTGTATTGAGPAKDPSDRPPGAATTGAGANDPTGKPPAPAAKPAVDPDDPASAPDEQVALLEAAIVDLLVAEQALVKIGARLGMTRAAARRLADDYRAAGRREIAAAMPPRGGA